MIDSAIADIQSLLHLGAQPVSSSLSMPPPASSSQSQSYEVITLELLQTVTDRINASKNSLTKNLRNVASLLAVHKAEVDETVDALALDSLVHSYRLDSFVGDADVVTLCTGAFRYHCEEFTAARKKEEESTDVHAPSRRLTSGWMDAVLPNMSLLASTREMQVMNAVIVEHLMRTGRYSEAALICHEADANAKILEETMVTPTSAPAFAAASASVSASLLGSQSPPALIPPVASFFLPSMHLSGHALHLSTEPLADLRMYHDICRDMRQNKTVDTAIEWAQQQEEKKTRVRKKGKKE